MISPVSSSITYNRGYISGGSDRPSVAGASTLTASKADSTEKLNNSKCQTCQSRTYQDVSDDPGVSFQTPTNVSPEASASAVSGHEGEHVSRERSKASNEGREVVSQTVTMSGGICQECGKAYVAGGETRTVTRKAKDSNPDLGKLLDTYQ